MPAHPALYAASRFEILPTSLPTRVIWHRVDWEIGIGEGLVLADDAVPDHNHHTLRRDTVYDDEESRGTRG